MELRKGYKKTEVGVIPDDWRVVSIEDISDVKGGKRLPKGNALIDSETAHPYIKVTDMFFGGVSLKEIQYVPVNIFPSIKNYRISKDDLFISVAGTLGIVGKIPIELDGANLTENADKLANIRCNKDFLLFMLMSPIIQNCIDSSKTLGAQPKLALTRIKEFKIPLPPIKEQQAIATALSDVDALITSLDKLIAKKRNIKQGAMQQLLTGKKRLAGFGGEWEVKTLEKVCVKNGLIRGPFGGALKKDIFVREGYKVYEQKNAIYRNSSLGNYFIDTLKYNELKRFSIYEGDFIVSCSGTIGKIYQIPKGAKEGIINQALLKIKTDDNIIVDKFFLYFFDWDKFQEKIIDNTQGGAMPNLVGMNIFRNTQIPLPSLPEQQAIAQILSDIDTEIETLEKKRDKYKAIKQGMMQELLTGKTRLINGN